VDIKQIGGILRAERKKLGKSLEQMAEELGVGTSTLSSIERGIHNVSREKWTDYAKALGMGNLLGVVDEVEERIMVLRRQLRAIEDISTANPEKALEQLTLLNQVEKVESMGVLRPIIHYLKGKCYFTQNKWEQAIKHFQFGIGSLEKYPELDDTNIKAACYNDLSYINHFHGQYQEALTLVQQGLACFVDKGERSYLKSLLLLNQCIYLDQLGINEKALQALEKLNAYIQENNYQLEVRTSVIIQMYIIHANILTKLHMPEKALEYAQQGEKIAWINQDYSRLFALWVQMGSIYLKMQELVLAEEYLLKALDLQSKLKQTNLLLLALKNFAILLIMKEEWSKVQEVMDRYLVLSKTHEDKQGITESLVTIGRWYQKQTQYLKAIDLYGIAESIVKQHGLNSLNLEIVTGLWFCYKQIGNQIKFQEYMEQMFYLQQSKEEKESFNFVDNLYISL
jgi:tetratricopeptide (TPR) repeat protein